MINKMIKRGFVDSYGDIYDINENDDNFDTVFGQIAESMGFEYSIMCSILLVVIFTARRLWF